MNQLQFQNTKLYISPKEAHIGTNIQLNSSNNSKIPYLNIGIQAANTGDFIESIQVSYFHNGLNKIEFILNFDTDQANKCLGNSLTPLNEIFERLQHQQISDIFKPYTFKNNDLSTELRYIHIYESCLALLLTILYLSHINQIGLKEGNISNLFAPFNFKDLIGDDDTESICQGLNLKNFKYIEPSAMLARNIGETPLLNSLSLVLPWTQLLTSHLPKTRHFSLEGNNLSNDGIFVAMSGVSGILPQMLNKIQSVTAATKSELDSSVDIIHQDTNQSINRINSVITEAKREINNIIENSENTTKESIGLIGTLKNAMVERLRQEMKNCTEQLEHHRSESVNNIINTNQNSLTSISNKEKTALQFIDDEIAHANTEFTHLTQEMIKVKDSFQDVVQEASNSITNRGKVVEERLDNIDGKVQEVWHTVENKKIELTDHCLMETQKMNCCLDDRKKNLCLVIDTKTKQTNEHLEKFKLEVDEKMNDLSNISAEMAIKEVELKEKVGKVLEQTQHNLNKIESHFQGVLEKLKKAFSKAVEILNKETKSNIHKIHKETDESIDHIRKETHRGKKCIDEFVCCLKQKLEEDMVNFVCQTLHEKLGEQLKEEGRSLESEIATALHKQLNDNIIQKRVEESLQCIKLSTNDVISNINSNYQELCQSLQISKDAKSLGYANLEHINHLNSTIRQCQKRIDAIYDESPKDLKYKPTQSQSNTPNSNLLEQELTKTKQRLENLETTVKLMYNRNSHLYNKPPIY